MRSLEGRVAVITGGASGIGRALAEEFVKEGMRVVLADVEQSALESTVAALKGTGKNVTGVVTDVTRLESVQALADQVWKEHGACHVLCNNAGVGAPAAKIWETTPNDWKWVFNVNVMGVMHGILAFVPRMIAAGDEGVIVNTSSSDGGIAPMPQASVYASSKAAVSIMTECLNAQLEADKTKLRAAIFYPAGGLLKTGLWTADRNRPKELERERPRSTPAMTVDQLEQMAKKAGRELPIQPLDALARDVVEGILAGRGVVMLGLSSAAATLHSRADEIGRGALPTPHTLPGL
jgi:NAD(P)-dependent dehydrogenase (short-subunit alcohol dehydrogenase family)